MEQKNQIKKISKKEKGKTRVMAVGDIHGDTGLVRRLAEKAEKENVDLVILAGDLTQGGDIPPNLIGPFLKAKKQVLIISGNHEPRAVTNFLTELYEGTKNLHGYSLKKGNLGIFGVGGADVGFDALEEKEFRSLLSKSHRYIADTEKKIMVTHLHPVGTKSEFSGIRGSEAIREAIEKFQPDFAFNAHVHEAGGVYDKIGKTKVINVSRKEAIFDI
ncbi:Calcineurin-like phosphoesterase [uncultured archaeon]|nr:Calcineurin-like phosphoesterase [uncultured archaeon]